MNISSLVKLTKYLLVIVAIGLLGVMVFIYAVVAPNLPAIDSLKDVQLQIPLRVYSQDNKLIGEFGEKRRVPLRYDDTPPMLINAILAAEDDRFFEHPGVDYQGILRAVFNLVATGEKSQGGSTITMQVARNFFLTSEKTYLRKLNEILLSFKIENELSKQEILELYLNKIYLGNRAYGFGAAAQVYYGKPVDELSLAQMAMVAGLPKAPSRYNPIANLDRALIRRDYVLRRMHELGYIDSAQYQLAIAEADTAKLHAQPIDVAAPYIAEMARAELVERYGLGEDAYTQGLRIYTTLDSRLQAAANLAVWQGLLEYDQRHGYRGPLGHIDIAQNSTPDAWFAAISAYEDINNLSPALVLKVEAEGAEFYTVEHGLQQLPWEGMSWAQRAHPKTNALQSPPENPSQVLSPGDIIQVQQLNGQWRLAQTPEIEGALVALSPTTGAIKALVGGFNFYKSKFNRAVQGKRQPGSSFKPFVYAAALEHGYTPATLINDAPVVFEDDTLETMWRPENYTGEFYGPTRLREALTHSRNLVSIRILRDIGINTALDYVQRFGINPDTLPRDLSMVLGSGSASPLEMTTGYAVFANGGYRVEPYFIERIENSKGEIIFQARPAFACMDCVFSTPPSLPLAPQVINPQIIYEMNSIMADVITQGTARKATSLGRSDLRGKTGTTNDQYDAWFAGFNTSLAATAWVGFDQPKALGGRETGGAAALPIWMYFMQQATQGLPEIVMPEPEGMVTVKIDPRSGKLAGPAQADAIFEIFRAEEAPQEYATPSSTQISAPGSAPGATPAAQEELF
ncbi:MAG: penicillin-binding protein 1A [Pseudomonadota bacterium]